MVRAATVKVIEARADYKGRLKLQFKVGDTFFCSTLEISSIAPRVTHSDIQRAVIECDIAAARTSTKRMKL